MSSMRGLQLAVMAQKTDPTGSALATLKMVDGTPSELSRSLYEIHMACGIDPAKAVETIHAIVGNNIDCAVIAKAAMQQIDVLQRKQTKALSKSHDIKTISEQAHQIKVALVEEAQQELADCAWDDENYAAIGDNLKQLRRELARSIFSEDEITEAKEAHARAMSFAKDTQNNEDSESIAQNLRMVYTQTIRALLLQKLNTSVGEPIVFETIGQADLDPLVAFSREEGISLTRIDIVRGENVREFGTRCTQELGYITWLRELCPTSNAWEATKQDIDLGLFKALARALPENYMYMRSQVEGKHKKGEPLFVSLRNAVEAEVNATRSVNSNTQSDNDQPPHQSLVALTSRLSRDPRSKAVSEKHTENFSREISTLFLAHGAKRSKTGDKHKQEKEGKKKKARVSELESESEEEPSADVAMVTPKNFFQQVMAIATNHANSGNTGEKKESMPEQVKAPVHASTDQTFDMLERVMAIMARQGTTKQPCFAFQKGSCNKNSCPYEHSLVHKENPPQTPQSSSRERVRDKYDDRRRSSREGEPRREYGRDRDHHYPTDRHSRHDYPQQKGGKGGKGGKGQGSKWVEGDCPQMSETSACDKGDCDLSHGKYDKKSSQLCPKVTRQTHCHFLWSRTGCKFQHTIGTTKNGSGR